MTAAVSPDLITALVVLGIVALLVWIVLALKR